MNGEFKRDTKSAAEVTRSCLGAALVLFVFSFVACLGLFAGGWLAWRLVMVGF